MMPVTGDNLADEVMIVLHHTHSISYAVCLGETRHCSPYCLMPQSLPLMTTSHCPDAPSGGHARRATYNVDTGRTVLGSRSMHTVILNNREGILTSGTLPGIGLSRLYTGVSKRRKLNLNETRAIQQTRRDLARECMVLFVREVVRLLFQNPPTTTVPALWLLRRF